jgi:hypothetical protein
MARNFWDKWPRRIVKNGAIRYGGKTYRHKRLEPYEGKPVFIDDWGDYRLCLVDDTGLDIIGGTCALTPWGMIFGGFCG